MKGSGVAMQINEEVLKSLSNEHNLPIAQETYQDLGKSAYKGEHLENELGLFLSAVKNRTVAEGSILVVYSLDRLSRLEIGHAKQTYYDLTNNGVSVYAVVDSHLYRAHNAADDIIATITFERAHSESKSKSRRVIDAAKEGLKRWKETKQPQSSLGRSPFWIDQKTNKHNLNAEGVLKAIEMYLQGHGILKIAQYLRDNYEYLPVRNKNHNRKKEDNWDISSLFNTFTRPSLIGEKHITVDGVKHKLENYYPPLIDLATFQRLKEIKELKGGRTAKTGSIHLLKGLVRCGICGGSMVFIDKGRGNHAINYVCSNAAKGKHKRENYSVQMLELAIIRLSNDELLRSKIDENSYEAERAQLLKQKDDLEHELIELKNLYKQKKRKTFLELIEDAEDRLESVISELEIVKPINLIQAFYELSDIKFDAEMMNDFNHPLRHELKLNLNKVIDHIQINRTQELSNSTKSGYVSCISITVVFKNKQRRVLTSTPFQYFDNVRGKNIFVGYKYEYDVPFEELTRNKKLIANLLSELHCYDLLHKLYPSKGRYEWTGMPIDFGTVHQKGTNLLGALKHIIESGSWEYGIKKQFSEGIQHTIIEQNSI